MLSKYVSNNRWIVSAYSAACGRFGDHGRREERLPIEDLIPRGLLGVRGEPVALDRFDRQSGDVLKRQVQHRVLGYAGVPVAHHPFLVKLSRFFIAEFGRDVPEGFWRAAGFGKGDGNDFRLSSWR